MEFDHVIMKSTYVREADRKVFLSAFGQAHHGKKCAVLRALDKDDKDHASDWDVQIAKTVVQLEDGTTGAVLNDEVRG